MSTELERAFKEEWGRAVSTLIRVLGDFQLAEDAVSDAFAVALERWPRDGLPRSPGAWIVTTARNRALDRLRREAGDGIGNGRLIALEDVAAQHHAGADVNAEDNAK